MGRLYCLEFHSNHPRTSSTDHFLGSANVNKRIRVSEIAHKNVNHSRTLIIELHVRFIFLTFGKSNKTIQEKKTALMGAGASEERIHVQVGTCNVQTQSYS